MAVSPGNTPDGWAQGKASKMRGYASGPVGAAMRAAAPVVSPGAPVCAWLGVAANGGVNENTTGWITGSASEREAAARNRRTPITVDGGNPYDPNNATVWPNKATAFHELGVFGVEGGPARGPCPAPGSPWDRVAASPLVRQVLGRAGKTGAGEWRSVPDQVTIGMVNNLNHGLAVNRLLPVALRFVLDSDGRPAHWSQWVHVCCTMGWSAGDSGARNHLALFPELSRVPEAERFSEWIRRLVTSGPAPGTARSHRNPWYSGVRTAQKLVAGVVASSMTGEGEAGAAFCQLLFEGEERARILGLLTEGGYSGRVTGPRGGGSSSSGASGGSSSSGASGGGGGRSTGSSSSARPWRRYLVGAAAGAGVLGAVAGGVIVYRRRRFAV